MRNEINTWALKNLKLFYSDGFNEESLREYFLKQIDSSEFAEKQSIMAASYYLDIEIILWRRISGLGPNDSFYEFYPERMRLSCLKNQIMFLYKRKNHFQLLEFYTLIYV